MGDRTEDDPTRTSVGQFVCECGCYQLVELTVAAFDGTGTVVAPGPRLPGVSAQSQAQ